MDLGLNGRTVIVTGASGGIGRELARAFAAEGAHVALTYHRSPETAELLAKEIGDRALAVPYRMEDPDSARALVEAVLGWTGRIDVLVNNAVRWLPPDPAASFEAVPDAAWQDMLRANVEGAVRLSRLVAPVMRERRWGRLIHLSSTLARDGMAGTEYYGAAKAALHGFSRSAAFSLGRDGDILSNVVMLGLTRTETNVHVTEAEGGHFAALSALGRLATAAEVAAAIVFLASAANTAITGEVIVTGGA